MSLLLGGVCSLWVTSETGHSTMFPSSEHDEACWAPMALSHQPPLPEPLLECRSIAVGGGKPQHRHPPTPPAHLEEATRT